MKTKLIISLLAFLAITTLAIGQNKEVNSQQQNGTGKGLAYADANNNGICDNYENRASNASSCKGNGNLNCCNQSHRKGQGQGQKGCCQRQGSCRNYIDANKNGICDHNEKPAEK
jgi:hypothetical protein